MVAESVKEKTGWWAVQWPLTDAPRVGYDAANCWRGAEETLLSARRWYRVGVDLVAIAAVSIAAYTASLSGYFLSDDFNVVTLLNADRTAVNWPNVLSDFHTVYRGDLTHSYYRPIITLSAALDYTLWGPNPFGGHLTNLGFNMINALLVYGIAAALPPSPTGGLALLAGLLFSLHPLHAEPVYWLVGRTELIVACFILFSILFSILFLNRRHPLWGILSITAFLLALGSKETGVVVPFAVTLHVLLFSDYGSERFLRRVAVHLTPYYLLLGAYFVLRKAITGHLIGQYGAMEIKLLAPSSIPKGIVHLFAYQLRPTGGALLTPAGDALVGQTVRGLIDPLTWILLLAIVGLVISARMNRRAWFCLGLLLVFAFPILSLLAEKNLPIDAARLYYLPSAAFCLFLAALLVRAPVSIARVIGFILFFAFAGLLAINSLPWIRAARITREIVHTIERVANRPGVEKVLVIGNPDLYFGAELFGTKSWALEVAAAAPFAKIPKGVQIINMARNPCAQIPVGGLRSREGTRVLRWDPERRALEELPLDGLYRSCRRAGMTARAGRHAQWFGAIDG